jgi:hypothetical protein
MFRVGFEFPIRVFEKAKIFHALDRARLLGRVISSSQDLCVFAPGDYDDGEVGGMNDFGRENRCTRENLPRRHFVHHKSHLPDPGANPGRRGGKPATNRFSYGAASNG